VAFQISQYLPSNAYTSKAMEGDTRIHFSFHRAPAKPVYLYAVGTFDSRIYVSNTSGVMKNYRV